MPIYNGKPYSSTRDINLRGSALGTGLLRWSPPTSGTTTNWVSNPFSSDDYGLYINSSGNLVYSKLGSTTVLSGGGGGGVPTWEQIFAADTTFNVAGTTWTIDDSTAGSNDVLTITDSGAGSGDLIQITNTGTGKDINGTSSTWSVTKLGAGAFLSVASATINGAGSGITIGDSGSNVVTIGTNSNTITLAKATTFSSTFAGVTGALVSTSNSVTTLMLTNNTATTMGAAASSLGLIVARSTSITTGTAIRAQLAEGTLTTGKYFEAWDSVGVAPVWSIGAAGAQTIGGAGGSTVFTITAGDLVMSDGSVAITDADNAATFSVTNNTATSNSVIVLAGSGVFTGTTTTSFMTLTPSGLTTGTALYVAAAAATTSVGVIDVAVAGLTSGSALRITSATNVLTTGGKLIELDGAATVAGNLLTATTTAAYTGTGMILVTAGAATTGVLVSVISTTGLTSGSLIRATSSTAGILATNGAISFTATGAFTSTSAVNGGFVEIKANSTTAGTITNIVGTALTTGIALQVSNGTSGMTSGSLVRVTASGTGTIATNGIVSITHGGIFVSTANAGVLDVAATALVGAGTVAHFSSTAASQTAANILNVTQSGATLTAYTGTIAGFVGGFSGASSTGNVIQITAVNDTAGDALKIVSNAVTLGSATLVNLSHTTSVLGAGSSMLRITSTGADTGTTTGVLLDLAATAATTAVLALITSATLTSGKAFLMNLNGLTTGAGMHIAHTTSVIASGGSLLRLSSTSVDTGTTTGTLLDLAGTATTGTLALITASAQTTGVALAINVTSAVATSASAIVVTQSGVTTGYTGSIVSIVGSQTTGGGNALGVTSVHTSAGDAVKIVANAITAGTSTGLLVSHTTSVLGAGNSMVRISSTSIDTGTTTGTLLDLASSAHTTAVLAMITDSSADTSARFGLFSKVTNTAAVLAVPIKSSNVAVVNSKFTKQWQMTDGTKTVNVWLDQDQTDPNGTLSGTAGDMLLNGVGGKLYFCTGTTSWTATT